MADVVFIVIVVAFFALCIGYVRGLDLLMRSAEESDQPAEVTH